MRCDPVFSSIALPILGERNYGSDGPTKHPHLGQKHLALFSLAVSKTVATDPPARDKHFNSRGL